MAVKKNRDQEAIEGGATLNPIDRMVAKQNTAKSALNNSASYNPTNIGAFSYDQFNMSDGLKNLQNQAFSNTKYSPSENVSNAYSQYVSSMQNKPADFASQYQPALNDTMNKILNREKFNYDLNGDALYQQYKDKYITQGQMAMQDTIGQASAMTGGYGNSYAATAGNQAYQSYLQQLNDRIPELYQLALDTYNAEGDALNNQYSMLNNAYQDEYGQYRDKVADWKNQVAMNSDLYNTLYNQDYNQFADDRSNTNNLYNLAYNQEYGQYGDDLSMKWNAYQNMVDQTQFNDKMKYQAARDAASDAQWQKEYDLNIAKLQQSNNEEALKSQISALQQQIKDAEETSEYKDTDNTNLFNASIMTEKEFNSRGGTTFGGKRYSDYSKYVDAVRENWYNNKKLSDDEVATLRARYGF